MNLLNKTNDRTHKQTCALIAAAAAGLMTVNRVRADDSPGDVTWSISGSTAMRNFTVGVPGTNSGGLTYLETPDTLVLSNGTYNTPSSSLQLAPGSYSSGSLANSTGSGVRVEWHEAGSVEGVLEMANDQIGYYQTGTLAGSIVDSFTPRNPTSGNPIWVNRNKLGPSQVVNSGSLSTSFAQIGTSTYNTYTNYTSSGTNLQGGQNRVQMAISDVQPIQGFSTASGNTPAAGTPIFGLRPGDTGYGKGNTSLNTGTNGLAGLATPGARQSLVDQTALNMATDKVDPQTGVNYGTGAWNSGGVNNLTTKTVAITATVFAANPGTGLTHINKTDAQWLQTTGRLKNGVDFNMTERDTNSGTRNVAALNTGVDPSWAVGENDGGNGYDTTANNNGTLQSAIGSAIKFSGKTAGGGLLRPTVQNNRMAIGVLSMSDAIGSSKTTASSTPLRALAYSDTTDSQTANYVQATAATITDGSYPIWQKEQYVTVRSPDANYSSDEVAKGDTYASGSSAPATLGSGNIVKLRDNVLNSVNVTYPNAQTLTTPADQLLANSFLLPQMMIVDKATDGAASFSTATQTVNGGPLTHNDYRNGVLGQSNVTTNFATIDGKSITAGSNSFYGVTSTTGLAAGAVSIPITAQDTSGVSTGTASAPGGNYLFGNFNQNGVRDFSAVEAAQAAQAQLAALGGGNSTLIAAAENVNVTTFSNSAAVSLGSSTLLTGLGHINAGTGPTKGDMVVLGDYNGDGRFDGKDLYAMAHGVAVADTNSGTTLTATAATFGDKLSSAVLVKNAALDYMQSHATAQQKLEASANLTNDPTGTNAFNKFDVDRDGLINRNDAKIVDQFVGKDYRNLTDQLGATTTVNGVPKSISLVDAELNDTGDITSTLVGGVSGTSDFSLIRNALGSQLLDGDANFDGKVDIADLGILATNYGLSGQKWSLGDFNLDGKVDIADLGALATDYGQNAPGALPFQQALALVEKETGVQLPEPASAGLLMLASTALLRRRRS